MWWKRRRAAADAPASGVEVDPPTALIEVLIGRVSDHARASSLYTRVKHFRARPQAEKIRQLPSLYLLLEQYLVEVEGAPEIERDALRRELAGRFPELCSGPLALVFATPEDQEVLLCRRLLRSTVRRARAILGAADENYLAVLDSWLDGVPESARSPVPLLARESVPTTPAGWVELLAEIGHELYRRLAGALGGRLAGRMMEEAFDELTEDYVALPTFAVVIDLLPDEILGERHIRLLSRAQMQRLLRGKIDELQTVNTRLAERGTKLQQARQALIEVNDQLEKRVAARTAELEYALAALSRSEERFRSLATAAHEAILMLDSDGRACLWNETAARLLGFAESEILGQDPIPILLPPAWQAPAAELVATLLREGRGPGVGETHELDVPVAGGGEVPLELSLTPVRVGGVWHLVCVARDISERRRAEAEKRELERKIQQRQRLESLGVLAGGIAHDFNNLLTAIRGHAELAAVELEPGSPARRDLEHLGEVTERAADLTGQLLAYSGRGQFVVEPVDLSELVERMAELVQVSISKRARLVQKLAADLPAIDADRAQLQQVVLNLITNASDALADQDGTITVESGLVEVDRDRLDRYQLGNELDPGSYVFVEVRDDGRGMGAETIARIFEPFFSTKRVGRGLGLAAVLGIVRGHKGAIRVDSEVGAGTTFRVLFPARRSPRRSPAVTATPVDGWRAEGTVLLVDDEPEVRRVTRAILERAGFTVLEAEDGEAGLELFTSHSEIVLVVLDLTMPRMDGEEALAAIHARRRVPVILISGYTEESLARHLAADPRVSFLQKPFAMDDLIAAARRALESAASPAR